MASFVQDLPIAAFQDRIATYVITELGPLGPVFITVSMAEDDLVSEFGQVPASIRVVVREPTANATPPAQAWLDAEQP